MSAPKKTGMQEGQGRLADSVGEAAAANTQTDPVTEARHADQGRASAPAEADPHHGMGGSYVIENGVRRRVEGPPLDDEPAAA